MGLPGWCSGSGGHKKAAIRVESFWRRRLHWTIRSGMRLIYSSCVVIVVTMLYASYSNNRPPI
jgi:hypothetical protein